MDVDSEIGRLYGLPLDEFTAARNALAKELRGAGEGEAAERVKGLKKPTAAAGALNQVVRESPDRLEEFLDAARELREAHETLLAEGDRKAVEAATRRERDAAAALVEAIDGSDAVRDRAASTLRAAIGDDELREELEAGRVVREREAVGLGPFAGAPSGGAKRKRAGGQRERDRTARRELKEATERERRAQRRLRDAGQSVAAASERAEAAMETLERARQEEAAARDAAEEAAAEVKSLERRLG